jgi:hypothetical protein
MRAGCDCRLVVGIMMLPCAFFDILAIHDARRTLPHSHNLIVVGRAALLQATSRESIISKVWKIGQNILQR